MLSTDQQFNVPDHVPKLADGRWKCKYCQKEFAASISITRIRKHLSKEEKQGIEICEKVPDHVQKEAYLASRNIKKRNTKKRPTTTQTSSSSKKRHVTQPATTTSPREQNNIKIANSTLQGIQAIPKEGCSTEPETEENRDFSCAQAGHHIENTAIEIRQPTQTSIYSERFPVHDRQTAGAAILSTVEGQNNLVEFGAVQECQTTEVQLQHENVENADMTEDEIEDMLAGMMVTADFDRFGIPIEDCYSNANMEASGTPIEGLVESLTIETLLPIQTSTTPERHPIDEPGIVGAAIPPADELGHNLVEIGAVDIEMQQEHQLMEVEMQEEQPLPNIYGKMDINATSTLNAGQIPRGIEGLPREQSNENANSTQHGIEAIPTEDCGIEPETRENRDLSAAQAGNLIENMTIEMQQPIQTSIYSERFPINDRDATGAEIQPTDEGQNNLVEYGAVKEYQLMEVELQQAHQPSPDLFCKMDIDANAPFLTLFEKLMSPYLLEFARREQVDDELEKWKRKLFKIQAVIDVAEVKQVTNLDVKYWLSNLRDLAYDAEDILDGFRTEALRSQLKRAESSTTTQGLPTSCADPQQSSVIRDMVTQSTLENITTRLEELVKEKNELCLPANVGRRSDVANNIKPSSSLVKEPKVFGREKVEEELVQLLLLGEVSNSLHSVIPIVGMPGVGKTTLAQLAYNDGRLKFDHKAWVCVSDEFDMIRMTKTILLHVGGDPEANNLSVLQQRLKDKLHKKKFLVVLDDIWEHKYDDWTTVCSPFAAGAPGSKIIITTRSKEISSRIGTTIPFDLKELSYDACFCLFSQHAVDAENLDAHPDLKEVGQKIVKRCKGLPLAAKTLGGLLRHNQQLQRWEEISNSEIWHLSEEESDILPALRLSYHHLPSHLKQCFAYCAIFPKDYEFDKDELVLLWMAEGFLRQPGRKQPEKDLGLECFNDLLSRCLFQESNHNKLRYVMHDLVNDLARFVSGETCFQLDDRGKGSKSCAKVHRGKGSESCAKVRHSAFIPRTYDTWQRFEVFAEMKSLRTFISLPSPSWSPSWSYLSSKVLDDLVPKFKCLRSLSLAGYHSLKELPNYIHALKHLRYLNLSFTSIVRLPESLGELLNLQTLKLCGCKKLVELPPSIGNLINLECLDVSKTRSLQKIPPEISKLKNLVTFVAGEFSVLRIGELKKLQNLRGQLHISGLHNTSNIREAKCFDLKEKQGIDELHLAWDYDSLDARYDSHEYQVLNSLQPHRSLRELSVTAYGGTAFPPWVNDAALTKLVDLQLVYCPRITSLPSLGKLPALRNLRLEIMNEVKEVAAEGFPSLETLMIGDMMRWEQWSWSNGRNEKFPKLHTLVLNNCPRLVGNWPICLPSLRELEIYDCPQLADLPKALPSLCVQKVILEIRQEVIFKSVHHFTFLTKLTFNGILGSASFFEGFVQALDALEDLVFQGCHQLKCLCEDGNALGKLANLKSLRVKDCEGLVSLVGGEEGLLPCNLQVLIISRCRNLEKMPNGLYSLTSLRELTISQCPGLVSFPEGAGLPCSLKSLKIESCGSLESLPHGMTTTTMNGNKNQQCLLKEISIIDCPSLKCFPWGRGGRLPTTLKRLTIRFCDKIEFPDAVFQVDDAHDDRPHRCLPHLEDLWVSDLSLASFPTGFKFPTLKTLYIENCKMPESLPSSFLHTLSQLTVLKIECCDELELFPEEGLPLPNLINLSIQHCEKLRRLPNHMEYLTSLEDFGIFCCSNIESFPECGFPPKLIKLDIGCCENCIGGEGSCEKLTQQPMSREWGLHALTSLETLTIDFRSREGGGGGMDDYLPSEDGDALLLPTSLIDLAIRNHENLKSISSGIQHLTSLQTLLISNCPNLKSLPIKEGFPPTLGSLCIQGCPLLKKRCLKGRGRYWPIIAHIPEVFIK